SAAEWEKNTWPREIRDSDLTPYFEKAEAILKPRTLPPEVQLNKVRAFKDLSERFGMEMEPAPLAIRFDQGTLCGECIIGCNQDAKNSVDKNYLRIAKQNGAQLFTRIRID